MVLLVIARRQWVAGLAVVAVLLSTAVWGARVLAGSPAQAIPATESSAQPVASPVVESSGPRGPVQNIVYILADDLDTATFEQVSRLRALHKDGLTFTNMVVTDSLCCPSRASILRSQYIHNHGVVSNQMASSGGWFTFAEKGAEEDCLPVWLDQAGIETAYIGKYLNGYGEDGDPTAIPAGWDRWFVPTTKSGMYRGYGYTVNDDRRLVSYATGREAFLPDVITAEAVSYIGAATSPFYLQINSTSPHEPAPVAWRHRTGNRSDFIPRTPAFNARGQDEPRWRARLRPVNAERLARYDQFWRKRVRSSESIADTVEAVMKALERAGTLDSTLIVVSSDNGFHAVSRRLPPGKRTPYREDTLVPTIFIGPGIPPGSRTDEIVSTVDLGPTFAELLGATVPDWVDGRSLAPLLSGTADMPWRTGVLTESMGESAFNDPDFQAFKPPKYKALRTKRWLYVEYETGARELFDRAADPDEIDNVVASTPPDVVAELSARLAALAACSGASCRAADTWAD